MKNILLLCTILFFTSCTQAEENKTPDFSKMTDEELIAQFMKDHKREKESFAKLEASKERLKKSEEELAKAKKLAQTVDKLNNMLGVKE